MKQRLAELAELRVDLLPYNPAVVALAVTAKEAGRPVVLATASNRKYAEQVAQHLGCLRRGGRQRRSDESLRAGQGGAARQSYGEGGYDYVGDSTKDLAVWQQARRAIVVDPQPGVLPGLRRLGHHP